MGKLEIRKAKYEDIEEIVDINIIGWKTAYRGIIDAEFLNSINRDDKIQQRRSSFYQKQNIVAVIDDIIVGYCTYTDDKNKVNIFKTDECKEKIMKLKKLNIDCEIQALYVKSDLRHNGIGKGLVNYVKEELKANLKIKAK